MASSFVLREPGCLSSSLSVKGSLLNITCMRGYFCSDMCFMENLSPRVIPALSKAGMMQSILFFVLTICDDHKRDYKGRWNQPHTFYEEAHKI